MAEDNGWTIDYSSKKHKLQDLHKFYFNW